MNAGFEHVTFVFTEAFVKPNSRRAATEASHPSDNTHACSDIVLDPDDASYSEKRSRWISETHAALHDRDNWRFLMAMHTSCNPATQLESWIATANCSQTIHVVCCKCHEIAAEWDHMLDDGAHQTTWSSLVNIIDDETEDRWVSTAVSHVIEIASDFKQRIVGSL